MITKQLSVAVLSFLICASLPGLAGFTKAAQADDNKDCKNGNCPQPTRPVCFNLVCSFQKDGHDGPYEKCTVASTFTHLVTEDGSEVWNNSEGSFNPVFEVQCDNEVIYNGSGHRYTDYLGTRIQAIPGPYPGMDLPPGSLREVRHYSDSTLEFLDQKLTGTCYIYTGPQ